MTLEELKTRFDYFDDAQLKEEIETAISNAYKKGVSDAVNQILDKCIEMTKKNFSKNE